MNYEDIKMHLQHALALLGDCEKNGTSAVEYDLILNELREAYAAVRFGGVATEPKAEPHTEADDECRENLSAPVVAIVTAATAEAEVQTDDSAEAADVAESDAETAAKSDDSAQRRRQFVRSLYAEMTTETCEPVEQEQPEPQQEAEPQPETEEVAAAEPETTAESEAEEEHTEDTVESAAEAETEATESAEAPAEEEPSETAPSDTESVETEPEAEEQTPTAESAENAETAAPAGHDYTHESTEQVLGDVINADIKTFADTLAPAEEAVADIVGKEAINSLNEAIGINDRFLLMRDLFHGSPEELDKAVEKLDSFTTLDDCLVHIVENYDWNPHCDGAKLIMSLIERRYGHR